MSLQPRISKVKKEFLNTYNDFAELYNLQKYDNLSQPILNNIYQEILSLKLNKYHNNIFNEIVTELLIIMYYADSYTKNELRTFLNKIDKNIQVIKNYYLKPKANNHLKDEKVNKRINSNFNTMKSNKKEIYDNSTAPVVRSKPRNKRPSVRKVSRESVPPEKTSTSELYRLLQNISDKSKEAIMRPDDFSDVKDYLHIETEIQNKLEKVIKNINTSNKSQLIILCGNVGDGKSHIISYLKDKHPEWFSNITIYNDATESNHPTKTAIETLEESLSSFDDPNINTSTEKMILAINIGVLNNFKNEMNKKEKYQKLIRFLDKSSVYKENGKTNDEYDGVHIVSFFEYSNIELIEGNVVSPFYEELFERLFSKSEDNIFYNAYLNDKAAKKDNIIHYNYELMLNKNVREKLLYILYRIQIQYNVIVSIRALNNFLFDILVPNHMDNPGYSDFLPFLLFDSQNESEIFRAVKQLDPVININNSMNKDFNSINIAYYNSDDYYRTTSRLIKDNTILTIFERLLKAIDKLPMNQDTHPIYIKTYLRILYLIEPDKHITDEKIYYEYIELLNAIQNFKEKKQDGSEFVLDQFRQLVMDTIKKWNGSISEKTIYIDNDMDSSIATAVNLNLTFNSIDRDNYSIIIEFKDTYRQIKHQLMVDYNLFKLLKKVNYGYVLKDQDKKENVYFQQFMNSIIYKTNSLESTIIIDKETNKRYELVDNVLSIEIK